MAEPTDQVQTLPFVRVLAVIDSLAVGGAEVSMASISPHLVARGIELHVAHLLDRPGLEDVFKAGGAELHSLSGRGGRLGAIRRTTGLVRELEPALVHTTLFEADLAGRIAGLIAGVPVVSSLVSEAYGSEHIGNPEYKSWKVRAARLTDATTARTVSCFHAVSEHTADVMATRLGIQRSGIVVIPRGRDPLKLGERSAVRRKRVRASLGIEDSALVVLAVGRHYHVKGLDIMLNAFTGVVGAEPSARLLIAGRDGPATSELRRIIDVHGLTSSVSLLGFRQDAPDLMCAADVFAFPSRNEGSPGILLEAMATETPIVASGIPAVLEIAGESATTMVITQPGSTGELSHAILDLLSNRLRANELARAARERFLSSYTIDVIADETLEFYRSCLVSQQNSRGTR